MSGRNFLSRNGGRHQSDPSSSRMNARYHQRGGRNNRPEVNRRPTAGDDMDLLMASMGRHLTTDGNNGPHAGRTVRGRRPTHPVQQIQNNQTGWWRITIQKAGAIGKERVMSTIKAHCTRQFQPYHYFIDRNSKDGVFFVNSQQEADMLKRINGKIEIQNLDNLRIIVGRAKAPIPSIDEDVRPHLKDYLLNRRYNHQTFQLDLSNLADDEELSTLGIYPQMNKYAFLRDIFDIINKDIYMTRILDLGSNNIVNLHEFRNLHLDHLVQLSLASNQIKSSEDFDCLQHFPQLSHLVIKNNPVMSTTKQGEDMISTIQQKLPQLKRIDDAELRPIIRFGTDTTTNTLPKSNPHCVPADMQTFLARFIDEYFRLFDTRGRGELNACYHETCMFSMCVSTMDNSIVPVRQYKFGPLIYDSRNLKRIDENRRTNLLRHGKTAVLDFFRIKFPLTRHDGNSFHIDVLSTSNNRAIFSVNGLFREVDQGANGPVRCFQRTFTCAQTAAGVLIIADHLMLNNATDAQVMKLTRSETSNSSSTEQTKPMSELDLQNQLIARFSEQSGMNSEFSKLCLAEHNWNYDKAAEVFLELHRQNKIPAHAFVKN